MPDPFDRVRKIALALPGVEEGVTFERPVLKVNGKYLAQMWRDGEALILSMEIVERDVRVEAEPEVFFITEHFRNWPGVLIHMDRLDDEALQRLIEAAWRRRAPKKLIKAYDAQK